MSKLAQIGHKSLYLFVYYNMSTQNKKDKSSQVPLFILKLVQILDNPKIEEVVGWTTTGDSFIIRNISRFTEEVLPAYYKHHNLASFIRQLNIYSFKKVRHNQGDNVYAHKDFIKGKPQLIKYIVRKSREEKEEGEPNGTLSLPPEINDKTEKNISELKIKQKSLYEMCRQFLYHNKKLLDENQSLVHQLEKDSTDKQRRLEEFLIYLITQKGYRAITDSNTLHIQSEGGIQEPQATPLEILASNMDQNENFKKMKSLLHSAFNSRVSRRRDKNFTIVQQKQENPPVQDQQNLHNDHPPQDFGVSPILYPNEENDFLSLDAFDFVDDDLNLDVSR